MHGDTHIHTGQELTDKLKQSGQTVTQNVKSNPPLEQVAYPHELQRPTLPLNHPK